MYSPKEKTMKNVSIAKNSKLDRIIDFLEVVDNDTGMPPILGEERAMVKLEVLCAQALARDVIMETKNQSHNKSNNDENGQNKREKVLNQFADNMIEHIKAIAKEILNNPHLQIDIVKELRRLNAKW